MERKEGEGWGLLFSAFPLMSVVQYVHTTAAAGVSPSVLVGMGNEANGKEEGGWVGSPIPVIVITKERTNQGVLERAADIV